MKMGKAVIAVVVAASALTAFTMLLAPEPAQAAPRAVPPDKIPLIEAKERARVAAGAPRLENNTGPFAGPDSPSQLLQVVEHTSRAELLARWQAQWDQAQSYFAALARDSGSAVADAARQSMIAERLQIGQLPDG